jgi:hypothetical protein
METQITKPLNGDELRLRRHNIFVAFTDHALKKLPDDGAEACALVNTALVKAWQEGAISQDTLLHNLRRGEILPAGRTNAEEIKLIGTRKTTPVTE